MRPGTIRYYLPIFAVALMVFPETDTPIPIRMTYRKTDPSSILRDSLALKEKALQKSQEQIDSLKKKIDESSSESSSKINRLSLVIVILLLLITAMLLLLFRYYSRGKQVKR
jgi:hypothetical protein